MNTKLYDLVCGMLQWWWWWGEICINSPHED